MIGDDGANHSSVMTACVSSHRCQNGLCGFTRSDTDKLAFVRDMQRIQAEDFAGRSYAWIYR